MHFMTVPAKKTSKSNSSNGGGAAFLPPSEKHAEDDTYIYLGWSDAGVQSRINRKHRITHVSEDFRGSTANFETDWQQRTELRYE